MSFPIREGRQRGNMNPPPTSAKPTAAPKPQGGGKVTHGSKDHEIENLKRLLADVSKRLDKLK